ncbi:LOW QUALITY PROTEIN: hypothetical protein PHPALM_29380 [Phytophthora palmivora]|uniref:Uncharacterized protein n=1 Tax=Phytophthora palmivora TaxID=4796 RepID=A0A2P4X7R2_9STRA|nr:LOW QUALITY PROTEIN: hypothetical protein PHPALM_29380 [Phytophthora palmivora]
MKTDGESSSRMENLLSTSTFSRKQSLTVSLIPVVRPLQSLDVRSVGLSADNVLGGHVRLSTHVRCSFEEADAVISLAKLMSGLVWSPHQTGGRLKGLMSASKYCNHLRLIPMLWSATFRRSRAAEETQPDVKWKDESGAFMNVTERSRAAEETQPDVKWINKSGAFMNRLMKLQSMSNAMRELIVKTSYMLDSISSAGLNSHAVGHKL